MKIRTRLLATTLVLSIAPLLLVGGLALHKSHKALSEQAFSQLDSVRQIKKHQIEEFFAELHKDMDMLQHTVSLLRQNAEQQLRPIQANKIAHLEDFFQERQNDVEVLSHNEWIAQALEQFHGALTMEKKIGGLSWLSIEERLGNALQKIQQTYGYFDLLLVAKEGEVVYSTRKGADLGQNLLAEMDSDTGLKRAFEKGLKQVSIEDFAPYAAAAHQSVLFISAPVYRFEELSGVLVLALTLDSHAPNSINGITQNRTGLGESGESFLVGQFAKQATYLTARIQTLETAAVGDPVDAVEALLALDGESGVMTKMTSNKLLKLSAYAPLQIAGLNWALISQINLEEAITPKLHQEQTDFFSQYLAVYGYQDLLLVHPEGQIFYSVAKKEDYGTNLLEDEYQHTHLAELVRQVLKSGQQEISDFALYPPSNNEPAIFSAQPLLNANAAIEFVLVLQSNGYELSHVIKQRDGMGQSGESYLVGSDSLMRSDSFLDNEHRSLQASLQNPTEGKVDTPSVRAALAGNTGEHISDNYLGNSVLSAYTPVDIGKQRWALIAEIDADKAFAAIHNIQLLLLGLIAVIILIAWWLAARFTGQLVTPLLQVRSQLRALAQGQVVEISIKYQSQNEIADIIKAAEQLKNALHSVIEQANSIAAGDYNSEVTLLSEKDELGRALVHMINTLRGVVVQANLIAQGDYSKEFKILSEDDQLGLALANMTHTLREMRDVNNEALRKLEQENAQKNRADWFKTGMSQLSERMSGQQDTPLLGKNIIGFLANYLHAQIGTFYLYQMRNEVRGPETQNGSGLLKLIGSYAYTKRKHMSDAFALGEGLVGQAALERQMIVITAVPPDYAQIQSSVGDAPPQNLAIVPFDYEEHLSGVFELGRFAPFTEDELSFLQQVTANIGIAVNTAESRVKMQELLEQSRAQSEELQNQAEELQSQQEELRQANEELEGRSQDLEAQKQAISEKNAALEHSQAAIEAKAQELELANKYKSEFLANMSHELRTPLNSMLILSQMLVENRHNNLTEQQIESARTINHAGSDLLNLINDILDLSKVEAGKILINPETFSLETLCNTLQRNFDPMAQNKGLDFQIQPEIATDTQLHTDLQRLRQILTNLLSNAFKFTDSGGSVRLQIRAAASRRMEFAVVDSGVGIPADKQKAIFEAFQQADGSTSRRYGGTGLGLTISRQLAKLLQGEIRLHSEPSKGSSFILSIPQQIAAESEHQSLPSAAPVAVLQPLAAPVAPPPPPVSEHSFTPPQVAAPRAPQAAAQPACADDRERLQAGDKSLLIVEDDQKFSEILLGLARERGFKVLCAHDGETGLQLAREYLPGAIILDIGLPQVDGWTVMSELKDDPSTRHIPVHFVSGTDDHLDARRMGAIGYLLKPVSMTELSKAFKTIENFTQKTLKHTLLVADDPQHLQQMLELLRSEDARFTTAANHEEAWQCLNREDADYDCIVVDVNAGGDNGLFLLEALRKQETMHKIPVIIYAERELTAEEERRLESCTQQLTVKSVHSPERLLDEATLFLHQVEARLPEDKRQMLNRVHDKDALFKGKTILLADDDMRNVFALGGALESKGMSVVLAKNGEEAVQQLQQQPTIDLVLMDVMMPKMDGFTAMRLIRAEPRWHKLPIIALTAKAMKNDRTKCIEAGASDYLSKPLDIDKLLSLMRVWLYR